MRRHPFYAGSHYDKTMTDFLTQEWASYRLRDLDDNMYDSRAKEPTLACLRSACTYVHAWNRTVFPLNERALT
jgi:hypothetical protein